MAEFLRFAAPSSTPNWSNNSPNFMRWTSPNYIAKWPAAGCGCGSRMVDPYWDVNCVPSPFAPPIDGSFQAKLLENMYDAVVFVDAGGQIKL